MRTASLAAPRLCIGCQLVVSITEFSVRFDVFDLGVGNPDEPRLMTGDGLGCEFGASFCL